MFVRNVWPKNTYYYAMKKKEDKLMSHADNKSLVYIPINCLVF